MPKENPPLHILSTQRDIRCCYIQTVVRVVKAETEKFHASQDQGLKVSSVTMSTCTDIVPSCEITQGDFFVLLS